MYARMYVCALIYRRTNSINYHEVWIGDIEERYGREVWNERSWKRGMERTLSNGDMEREHGTGVRNRGMARG